jgi:hypothetical protein
MPRDDRERRFEKALARHLRANPLARVDLPNEAGRPAEAGARQGACPDAEVLAAYHERMLAPEQMISWKEHIAACSRCQEVLAPLEATDELVVNVEQEKERAENLLMMKEPRLAASEYGVAKATTSPSPAALRAGTQIPQSRRSANWRWLGPAGAIAAGLLVWVGIHETNPPRLEMAKNQPTTVSAPVNPLPSSPPAAQSQTESPVLKREEESRSSLSASVPSESRKAAAANTLAAEENSRAALKQMAPAVPVEKAKTSLDQGQLADKSLSLSRRKASELSALPSGRFDAGKDAKEFEKQAVTAAPATPSKATTSPVPGVAGGAFGAREPAKPAQDQAALEPKKEAPAAMAESVQVQAETQTQTQRQVVDGVLPSSGTPQLLRLARGKNPMMIFAPNRKVIWRIGAAGIVEHSTNAGATWTLQTTGVIADFLAGSAPSDKVCWIAGRSGTILRTTDRGAHWVKVHAPVDDDLAGVFAVDAQQATVTAASNHQSYRTTDGGLTWTPLPSP